MPIATPEGNNPLTGVMQSIMLRYHADMEAQVEHTLADLAGRWQGVRASLLTSITRLERQMQAAVKAGDTITYTWLAQQARLLDLKAAVAGDIAAYAAGARDIIGQAQGDAAELGLAAAQAKLDALTPPGVNYTWGVPPRDVLDQIAGATQPYTPLYALFEQMGAQAATNAAQALFQSVALGEGPREAARRLVWATDMSARRAEVIARTEIHRAWRQAQFANYQANSDVVSSWMWSADFASERTCGACIALDGSIHPLDEELADHVCGRCDAIPVTRPWSDILAGTGIPDDELAALDEGDASTWMDYRESGGEWLARQPADTQNRVLGPAKAEAWRQGAISLRDVASITHDPTWGRSIEERSLKSLGLDAQKWLAEARSNGTAATTMSEESRTALSEWEQQRAAAIAEVKAAEAEAAAGVAQPSEWEARRAAAIAEAEGFGAAAPATQALAGSANDAAVSPVWQDIADKLTPANVTYTSDVARERLMATLGTQITDEQVANLAGAPAGAVVDVSKYGEITVTAPDGRYISSVYVQRGENGPILLNWRFEGPDGTNAIAVEPEALAIQVRQANALGIDGIHMKARFQSSDYAELPLLGYNAPIEQVLTESRSKILPAGLERAQTLLEILATPEGRVWWSENGLNPGLDFDPHPGSLSWQILDAYLHAHGLRGLEE